jgi:beta-N-acetylhexosaminidase
MGFQGVIVSDAMDMQGLTKLYPPGSGNPAGRAAADAVKAGQDLLELPSDLDGTYNGLLQAVKSGEIPQSQIDASVRRLLLVKARAGLDSHKGEAVDLDEVQQHFGKLSSYALAREVAEHAITLVRDDNHLLPMKRDDGKSTLVILFVSDPHGDDGRMLEQQIRARLPAATVVYVDRRSAPVEADGIAAMLPKFGRVIAAIYSVPQPGQVGSEMSFDTISVAKGTPGTILQTLLDRAGDRTVVLAMGSPYIILSNPNIRSYACAFSSVSTSETAMVRALFGEIPIHGKLPVTLPNVAKRGDGMDMNLSATGIPQ